MMTRDEMKVKRDEIKAEFEQLQEYVKQASGRLGDLKGAFLMLNELIGPDEEEPKPEPKKRGRKPKAKAAEETTKE